MCVGAWDDAAPWRSISRVQYAAHSWNAEYDCTAGECAWEKDGAGVVRLAAYAGLHSHAMYPTASPLWLYQKVRVCTHLALATDAPRCHTLLRACVSAPCRLMGGWMGVKAEHIWPQNDVFLGSFAAVPLDMLLTTP